MNNTAGNELHQAEYFDCICRKAWSGHLERLGEREALSIESENAAVVAARPLNKSGPPWLAVALQFLLKRHTAATGSGLDGTDSNASGNSRAIVSMALDADQPYSFSLLCRKVLHLRKHLGLLHCHFLSRIDVLFRKEHLDVEISFFGLSFAVVTKQAVFQDSTKPSVQVRSRFELTLLLERPKHGALNKVISYSGIVRERECKATEMRVTLRYSSLEIIHIPLPQYLYKYPTILYNASQ